MSCKGCVNRENIVDFELMDVVGYKCTITDTIISAEVEDEEDNCINYKED